jgi:hypothetical protein
MRLIQFLSENKQRQVGVVQDATKVTVLRGTDSVYQLISDNADKATSLQTMLDVYLSKDTLDYEQLYNKQRLLVPFDHPDPAHCLVTGTGLNHLGSATARDAMHVKPENEDKQTDSMKMYRLGLAGGKPKPGETGVQPEWFYKGNGHCIVAPGQALEIPSFGLTGGEEVEIVGVYMIASNGDVLRVGYALGNEFADHQMESQNYLYLAHSKLRACSFGPELLVDELPKVVEGKVRVLRNNQEIWSDAFYSGEDHMTHSLANLEQHHFKYSMFRQPGDVHLHFFGAALLSYAAGVKTQAGDVFELSSPTFGRPLQNPLAHAPKQNRITVRAL